MLDIVRISELFCKHPFGKVLGGLVVAILLLMFYEQYTNTFKLSRLKSIAGIVQQTKNNAATCPESDRRDVAISNQIQNELQEVLNPKPISPWWERIVGGWIPLLLIALLWWKSDKLAVLRLGLNGLLFAILLALLPDFLPSMLHCMAVSVCLLFILIAIAVYNLHNPPKRELRNF